MLSGQVLLPDGAPAAAATVTSSSQRGAAAPTATADSNGRFQLPDAFKDDLRLIFRSADRRFQSTLRFPAMSARVAIQAPVTVRLKPAVELRVRVVDGEGPVANARVAVDSEGSLYRELGSTDERGEATLLLPPDCPATYVAAWHPERGVAGSRDGKGQQFARQVELRLQPPRSRTIQVLDPSGGPISEIPLAISFRCQETWAVTAAILDARVRPDADGRAQVPWAPRDAEYMDVEVDNTVWLIDDIPRLKGDAATLVLKVRPKHVVKGQLKLPDGASAAGLLVQGRSFGPGSRGDFASARAAADGTFALPISAEHCYALGVVDEEWASDLRSGVILASDEAKPSSIEIPVYAATPVEFRVTRGAQLVPVNDAWININGTENLTWIDSTGKEHRSQLGMHAWVKTNDRGVARAALGKGAFEVGLRAENWWELRSFKVVSDDAMQVAFHRRWEKTRGITGTVLLDGRPRELTPNTSVKLWASSATIGFDVCPTVPGQPSKNGTFTAELDNEVVTAFAYDPVGGYAGVGTVMADRDDMTIELRKNGVLEGTLVDSLGQPMAGMELALKLNTTRQVTLPTSYIQFIRGGDITISTVMTDDQGRFRFDQVPAGVEVQPFIANPKGRFTGLDKIRVSPGKEKKDLKLTFEKQPE
ncbi:MAG TPA: carboxypeptidase-like regulatory domain-containing protein [Caulifigura sp.]|nr:carboxypeptidase-like regulatory domain-containing protein [Caulifigura sp.]